MDTVEKKNAMEMGFSNYNSALRPPPQKNKITFENIFMGFLLFYHLLNIEFMNPFRLAHLL